MAKEHISFDGGMIVFKKGGSFFGANGLIEYDPSVQITLLDKTFKVNAESFFNLLDACTSPENIGKIIASRKLLGIEDPNKISHADMAKESLKKEAVK